MRVHLTLLVALFCTTLSAQISNYFQYQTGINQAELSLVRGDKSAALAQYTAVLSATDGTFVKDIHNALVIAGELEEKSTFFRLLDLLLPKELTSKYIREELPFFTDDSRWEDFVKANEATCTIDLALREKINQLQRTDQEFRVKPGSYKVYGDTIKAIDRVNMTYLMDLIARDEFPGENKIGVINFYGKQGYDIVFHHYTQANSLDSSRKDIDEELIGLVLKGKIQPSKVSHWLEMQNGEFTAGTFDVFAFQYDGHKTGFYAPKYSPEDAAFIKKTRERLGMESLAEYYEKFIFSESNPEYKFDLRKNIVEIDKATAERVMATMRKLE